MILLFFVIFILLVGFILLLMFIGGIITLFMEKPKPTEQVEVTTVNQFSNEKDVIQPTLF